MILSQEVLRAHVAARVADLRHRAGAAMRSPPERDGAGQLLSLAVQRRFDPGGFTRSILEFTQRIPDPLRAAWLGTYTRTVFLAGDPANLVGRFRFDYIAPDDTVAWTGPLTARTATGLRRLLVLFDGSLPADLPREFVVTGLDRGGRGREHKIYLGTAGLSVADYLIHLTHLLAEAVLTGVVGACDTFRVCHVDRLEAVSTSFASLRVQRDKEDAARLRAYAGIAAGEDGHDHAQSR